MFNLSEVHPALSGQLATGCRQAFELGFERLIAHQADRPVALVEHVTEFDFDGLFTTIEDVSFFDCFDSASEEGRLRLEKLAEARLAEGRWDKADTAPREANILPATGSVVPGRFPAQAGFVALRASDYETCYFRTYVISEDMPGGLIPKLFSLDGIYDDLVSYLISLGSKP